MFRKTVSLAAFSALMAAPLAYAQTSHSETDPAPVIEAAPAVEPATDAPLATPVMPADTTNLAVPASWLIGQGVYLAGPGLAPVTGGGDPVTTMPDVPDADVAETREEVVDASAFEMVAAIDDILLSPEGQVVGYVVDVGGFLGIGSKTVVLDVNTLERTVYDGQEAFTTTLTKAELEALPDFDKTPIE